MSKNRKPKKPRLPRELRRPPNNAESMEIVKTIFGVAAMVADGKPTEAVDTLQEWMPPGPVGSLRCHYLATVAPLIAMGLIRKHFPVDMAPDDLWVLERVDGLSVGDDPHADAMAQVLVRYLNDEVDTAHDLITAHHKTYGDEGLFWVGVQAVKCVAGVLTSAREAEAGGEPS